MAPEVERRRPGAAPSLIAAGVPSAVGVFLLVLGWTSVSTEAAFDGQQTGMNVALLGGLVVMAGCGFYLWAFRRRITRRVNALRLTVLRSGAED